MPPWVASAPRLTTLRTQRAIERLAVTCHCRHAINASFPDLGARSASTHIAPTAINLRPNIPPGNKELYDALSALSGVAETYANISRLQLALRGLAAQDAVTRVAVLGLNSQVSAQRLARLLLADPLGAEQQWEKELEKSANGNERAVLLKYGDESDTHTPTPLYKLLSIPSRILQSHNLEILVSTLNVNNVSSIAAASAESSSESIMVPKLQATSARGLPVPYPVHKTLIFGEGLDSAIAFGRFSTHGTMISDHIAKLAVDLPASSEEVEIGAQNGSTPVNIDVAKKALEIFRESVENSLKYEHAWFRSGLPTLSNWLIQDLETTKTIKPTMQTLIASIADDVESNIIKEELAQAQKTALILTTDDITTSFVRELETWAETSHAELRDELDEAFSPRNWQKLSWWKLFWRVDDVSMISSEILERRWLVSAEKTSIYLAGRMNQAGFPGEVQSLAVSHIPEVATQETAPTAENSRYDLSTEVRKPQPWLEYIASARTELVNDIVPPLQALAQRLLLQTFSTTSISSAISVILYVAMPTFSVFEASAVAALGLTFSLRRMQKLWEGARESWQGTVREEGRRTLKGTEDVVRMIVKVQGTRKVAEDESAVERRRAREAVRRVREALMSIRKGENGV